MKSFFGQFKSSALELKKLQCIVITGMFIAVSMSIEAFTIQIPFAKINFAFLAIAVIGMLYGPFVGFFAGGICDIVGYFVHPEGGFLFLYVLIGALQGLIYGIILYHKRDKYSITILNNTTKKDIDITLYLRAIIARLLDVMIINLLLNTRANMYYGFIPDEAYSQAIIARVAKNVIELFADIPLLLILLPIAMQAYKRVYKRKLVEI